jgi:hypothetical protein
VVEDEAFNCGSDGEAGVGGDHLLGGVVAFFVAGVGVGRAGDRPDAVLLVLQVGGNEGQVGCAVGLDLGNFGQVAFL